MISSLDLVRGDCMRHNKDRDEEVTRLLANELVSKKREDDGDSYGRIEMHTSFTLYSSRLINIAKADKYDRRQLPPRSVTVADVSGMLSASIDVATSHLDKTQGVSSTDCILFSSITWTA